jgi:8-oxo-dGTP diphosphatase
MPKRSLPYRPDRPIVAELAAGGIVLAPKDDTVLLLHERSEDRWTLPKGHVEKGESLYDAAVREITEEAGTGELVQVGDLGEISYRFFNPRKDRNVMKVVTFFLVRSLSTSIRLEEIFDRYEWVGMDEALSRVAYETERQALQRARDRLASPSC